MSLLDLLNFDLPESTTRRYFIAVVDILTRLHFNGVYHGDIKLENILVSDVDGTCTLTDFEFSDHFRSDKLRVTRQGSLHYAAPEIMSSTLHVGWEPDIWALGIILYALLTGYFPFGGNSMDEVRREQIKYCNGEPLIFPADVSQDARELVRILLTPNHQDRPRADQIMEHTWCSQL